MTTTIRLVLPTVLALSLASAAAEAQSLRPNIMILLDTSGSMLYNQANDGSPLCGNNANGQGSRVFNMKHAIRDALAQAGTDEANFGLARFPQVERRDPDDADLPQRLLDQRRNGSQWAARLPVDDPEHVDPRDDLRHTGSTMASGNRS